MIKREGKMMLPSRKKTDIYKINAMQ